MEFGQRLLALRKYLNLTQIQFAEPLGVNRGYIATLETSDKEPSKALLKLISYEYGISYAWLKTGEGEMFISPKEALENQIARFGEQAIIEAFTKIMQEHGLAVASGRPVNHHTGAGDAALEQMIATIHDLWNAADEDMKGWIKVQLHRAFPEDVIEEAQKKQKSPQEQASAV